MELCCHPNKSETPRKRLQHRPQSTGGTQQFAVIAIKNYVLSKECLFKITNTYHLPVIDGHECIEV